MKQNIRSVCSFISYLFFLVIIILNTQSLNATEYSIYFYNPESNIDNFALLKRKVERYLKTFGNYKFHPFDNRDIFEKAIENNDKVVIFVSSWYFKSLSRKRQLTPWMVGVIDGKSTQTMVLSAKNKMLEEKQHDFRVASSGTERFAQSMIKKIVYWPKSNAIQILSVPKEIDALISVGYGMADAALTSMESLKMLTRMDSSLSKKIRVIGKGQKLLLPIIALPTTNDRQLRKLMAILEVMPTFKEGRQKINLFGLDSWRLITAGDLELL